MQEFEEAYNSAAGLYSIAFLLTGRSELSLALTMEVLDSENDGETFFSFQRLTRLRSTVIEKAVASVREEIAVSARQTAWLPLTEVCMPPSTWSLAPNTSRLEIERALLAIEIFPRCALLLIVFEGLSFEGASILLSSNEELTVKGQLVGLWDLTRYLARLQGWNPSAIQLRHASFESGSRSLWSEP